MTIGKAIATSALLLACVLAGMKLAGQSFASFTHDRPFLVASPTSQNNDLPASLGVSWWWHGGDNSNGAVAVWTNRAGPASRFETNGVVAGPTATNGYVEFNGASVLSNQYIGPSLTLYDSSYRQTIAFVLSLTNGTDFPVLTYTNANANGFYVRSGNQLWWYAGEWVVENWWSFYLPQTLETMDIAMILTNSSGLNFISCYTNGILSKIQQSQNQLDSSGLLMGYVGGFDWYAKARIYDFMIFTNAWDSTSISNFHRWRTNTYGGSI